VNIKSTSWLAISVVTLCMAGNALAATVYTNRAEFEAALLSFTVEDFESYQTNDTPDVDVFLKPTGHPSLELTYFSLAATPDAIKILDAPHSGSHNTSSGSNDSQFLYLDTDAGLQGVITADITLKQQVDAFGFNYTGVFEPDTDFTVTIGSYSFNLSRNNPESTPLFWGVLGLGDFTQITLYTSSDSAYGVDDVIFGSAVPLPPAIWLFGSGLLALVGSTRKGKAHN
jgi:hypothetical protein